MATAQLRSIDVVGSGATTTEADRYFETLERDGVVVMPNLIPPADLEEMQDAFSARLSNMRWNNVDGYIRTDWARRYVEDLMMLGQSYVDLALHPTLIEVLDRYLGQDYRLVEAKGWESLPTHVGAQSWHGDVWFDAAKVQPPYPREIKVAVYLTDVKSGYFQYLKGTQGKKLAVGYGYSPAEVAELPMGSMEEFPAQAGTVIAFDTSGAHRQAIPILEKRNAYFLVYHDPRVPLEHESYVSNRYHPLTLNAAFLGKLTPRHMQLLGFGDTSQYQPSFAGIPQHPHTARLKELAHTGRLYGKRYREKLQRGIRKAGGLIQSRIGKP